MDHNTESKLKSIEPIGLRSELIPRHDLNIKRKPRIIKVRDGVYCGILYDLANVIVIETLTGVIIVDVLGTNESANNFLNDFKSQIYSNKLLNIEAIILTHNHWDHIGGIESFIKYSENQNQPQIYVHELCKKAWKLEFNYLKNAQLKRNARQFGVLSKSFIPSEITKDKNLMIPGGIFVQIGTRSMIPFKDIIFLNKKCTFIEISNLILKIYHSPGETNDMLLISIPSLQLLCCGDNFYHAFPNLYAIRGTVFRDVKQWINSIDLMRYLTPNIKYLCGGHSKPVIGIQNIYTLLTLYRDAVSFVHDQTLRLMNFEYDLSDIVLEIERTMPLNLRIGKRSEFYGTVEWGIRTIYAQYLGWFGGDPSELYPASDKLRGNGLDKILFHFNGNNINKLIKYLKEDILYNAYNNNNNKNGRIKYIALKEERWILEFITWLNKLNKYKNNQNLKQLRYDIIKKIASRCISSNGRNYLISYWLEEEFKLDPAGRTKRYNNNNNNMLQFGAKSTSNFWNNIPINWYIKSLQNQINPQKCIKHNNIRHVNNNFIEFEVGIIFIDSDLFFYLQIRNGGILEVKNIINKYKQNIIKKQCKIIFKMNEINWKNKEYNNYVVKGNQYINKFWNYFDINIGDSKSKL